MAKCSWCRKEMTDKKTIRCAGNKVVVFPDKTKLPSLKYAPTPEDPEQLCPDCNVKPGEAHHPGCDMERCPKCKGQLITCGCLDKSA